MKKILVEGMKCEHCKAHVEKALNAIDGIQATVDLEKNCAFVEGWVRLNHNSYRCQSRRLQQYFCCGHTQRVVFR